MPLPINTPDHIVRLATATLAHKQARNRAETALAAFVAAARERGDAEAALAAAAAEMDAAAQAWGDVVRGG